MKLLETRVIAYDMMATFTVLDLVDEYDLKLENLWGDHYATGVNLFKHWSKISLQKSILFQSYSYDNCVYDEDIISC